MIFFFIGIYCINIYIKVLDYTQNSKPDALTLFQEEPNETEEAKETKEKIEDIIGDLTKLKSSLVIKTKNEIKLETLFATDIDCGMIVFSEETKKFNLRKKIKLFILKFCYTPGFCLHACRLSAILWINLYMTYASLLLIIWLLFSIKYSF